MALSMDEERILAEIEHRLARADPALAARLSSFGRARRGPVSMRSSRTRMMGSFLAVIIMAVISLTTYAMIAFRGTADRSVQVRSTSSSRTPTIIAPAGSGTGAARTASSGPAIPRQAGPSALRPTSTAALQPRTVAPGG